MRYVEASTKNAIVPRKTKGAAEKAATSRASKASKSWRCTSESRTAPYTVPSSIATVVPSSSQPRGASGDVQYRRKREPRWAKNRGPTSACLLGSYKFGWVSLLVRSYTHVYEF